MSTYRQQLQKLLEANEGIMDAQPSDELYEEWADLAKTVSNVMDGFVQVLSAAKACRDAQAAYFKARKAGFSAVSELEASKKAEKILDDLVRFWTAQMAPPPKSRQGNLFE